MAVAIGLLALLLLLTAHGVFVAGEFSLVAAPRERMERLAAERDRRARRVVAAMRSLSFQLSGAQLGITMTSLLLGLLVEAVLAEALAPLAEGVGVAAATAHAVAAGFALAFATAAEMVFAELVPKNYAIARPIVAARRFAGPLWWFNWALRPLIVFLNASANWLVRRLGIEPREELRSVRSLEELELLIRSSGEEGTLGHDEATLLTRTIRFGHRNAADALVPRVEIVGVPDNATVAELFEVARRSGHSRFPVYGQDLDDVVGVADVKDGFTVPAGERDTTPVTSIARAPYVTPDSRPLDELLADMRREDAQLAVVVDEYGGTDGIVTLEDLLEEIVGAIEDEYDEPSLSRPPLAILLGRDEWLVEGSLHLDEVAEATGFIAQQGGYETIAGFVLDRLGRIPDPGDVVIDDGWALEVRRLEGRRIAQLRLFRPQDESSAP